MLEEVLTRAEGDSTVIIGIEFAESGLKGRVSASGLEFRPLLALFGRLPPAPTLTIGTFLSRQVLNRTLLFSSSSDLLHLPHVICHEWEKIGFSILIHSTYCIRKN